MKRSSVKSWMVRSQAAAGVLLVAGAAIALAPIDFGGNVPEARYVAPPPLKPVDAKAAEPLDPALSARLIAIALEQPSEPKPAPPPADPLTQPDQPPAPPKIVWEYLGGLIGPSSRRAIVTLSGEQRMLKEGDVVDGTRVNAITATYIMVEEDGAEKRINRKDKQERLASAPPGAASGKALAARGPQASKSFAPGPSKGPAAGAKAERLSELREKQRQQYIEAMRMSNYAPPDPDMMTKFGISDFKPTDQDMEAIMRQVKDELNGPGEGDLGDQQEPQQPQQPSKE
ncbi:MAG: hypothetical protein AB7K52_10585 [Phycisphaerales bacterium]